MSYWGGALCRFQTSGNTAYDFSPHVQDVAHSVLCGRVGSGKSFLSLFLAMMADRAGVTVVFMDKGRGAEPAVVTARGRYLTLRSGQDSGCAPLRALADTALVRAFLGQWLTNLIESDGHGRLQPHEPDRLARAIARQMRMPPERRSLAGIRELLGGFGDPLSAGNRLEKWTRGGALGWAFDGADDRVRFDTRWLGFDLSSLFNDPVICAATAAYLVHRIGDALDGRRFLLIWDEVTYSLQVETFARIIRDFALAFRKQEAWLMLACQHPDHIRKAPFGAELLAQCVNRFVFPVTEGRADENRDAYMGGLGLSVAAYRALTEEMPVKPFRTVLLDRSAPPGGGRGGESAVLRFDLSSLQDEIAVLSGREENIRLLDEIRGRVGDDPEDFLPEYLQRAKKVRVAA